MGKYSHKLKENFFSFITRQEMLEIVNAIFIMVGNPEDSDPENSPAQRVDLIFGRMDKVSTYKGWDGYHELISGRKWRFVKDWISWGCETR